MKKQKPKSHDILHTLRWYAETSDLIYLEEKHLRDLYPYDAATGWQMFNAAKMVWWSSELRKPQ
jgi:hypothetical protein